MKIQRKFLWEWSSKGKKIPWIKWENLCKSREKGKLALKA